MLTRLSIIPLLILMAPISSALSAEMVQLASQGTYFTLSAATIVIYGAADKFIKKNLQPGTYFCNDSFFGDPISGVVKSCYKEVPAGSFIKIADQPDIFTLTSAKLVNYGSNGIFVKKVLQAGTYQCNDSIFGDPVPGIVKACYLLKTTDSLSPVSNQNGSFILATTSTISYGANGVFFQKTLMPGTYQCNDAFFGDPIWGVAKACYKPEVSSVAVQNPDAVPCN